MRFSSMCRAAAKYDTFTALKNRSLIHQCTDEKNLHLSLSKSCVTYTGFDPTARSLHVGNLLTIVSLMHFWAGGHKIIALIGGATGAIGDPSGKSKERVALDESLVKLNSDHIQKQLHQLFHNAKAYLKRRNIFEDQHSSFSSLNNIDWIGKLSLIDFLQTVGRKARISMMMAKDSVQGRMNEGEGISYSEFSYQLLQAYDFLYLHDIHNCKIQLGGSDQYGNITAGLDLIRKSKVDPKEPTNAFGITIPLVTTASGKKFGKSEGNAIWLDSSLLSIFDFYQFFRRSSDDEVERLLYFFTFLSEDAIADIMSKHKVKARLVLLYVSQVCTEKQLPQRLLAMEVTELVHGYDEAKMASIKSSLLYDHNSLLEHSVTEIENAFRGDKRLVYINDRKYLNDIVKLAVETGATKSSNSTIKLIQSGGLYVNDVKWPVGKRAIDDHGILVENRLLLLRTGKTNYRIVIFPQFE